MFGDAGNRLGAAIGRTWNRRPRLKQTTWIALIVASASLGMAVAVFVVRRTELDLGVPTYPPFTTQESPWTTTATTTPRRSGQGNGATATSTSTNPGGTGTTTQGYRSRVGSTTTSIPTGAATSTLGSPTTTTQPTDPTLPPTSFPRPTGTTSTVPEPTGGQQ